ncbi:MAG TPA: class I SAM-dependent rRNA methyltransferase [Chitinivibrionales bacterium]
MLTVHLKKGRDKPVRNGHPWVFSGSIAKVTGKGLPGEFCVVLSDGGAVLGGGYYNPASAIQVRMLTKNNQTCTVETIMERLDRAVALRTRLPNAGDAYRLINSEGDFLPGLIVDKYNNGFCVQILTAGMELLRNPIIARLKEITAPDFIYERSDTDAREREGLEARRGLLDGAVPRPLQILENSLRFGVDLENGQKTGFFIDQKNNRKLLASYARDAAVCDCFAYSGAFSVYALAHGAKSAHIVDISKTALETAKSNAALNNIASEKTTFIADDVFSFLRTTDTAYDLIVLDPPKFAKHPGEVERAARGYKDINLLAFKRAAPNGVIFTFSCSNAVEPRLFRQIVFAAAADSGRMIQVLQTMGAGADHPVNIAHPEGDYLKGLIVRVA